MPCCRGDGGVSAIVDKEVCERMLGKEFKEIDVEVSCESYFSSGAFGEDGIDGSLEVAGYGLAFLWILCSRASV